MDTPWNTPASKLPERFVPIDTRRIRQRMNLTQQQFAGYFGFPVATLRHWERGNRSPSGTALALLLVIRDNPRAVMTAIRKARISQECLLPKIERLKSYRAPPGFGDRPAPLRKHRRKRVRTRVPIAE